MDDARDQVDGWLRDLGGDGEAALRLDDDGLCALSFGDNIAIAVEVPEGGEVVSIYAVLGPVPDDPETALDLLFGALESNLFQAATGGGALALEPENGLIVLCYLEEIARADADRLADLVAHCHETAVELRGALFPPETENGEQDEIQDGVPDALARPRNQTIIRG